MNIQGLIDFENDIKELFIAKEIRSPVHLSCGNESHLIEIFKEIGPKDWVVSSHRSHYHALLKGIPEHLVRKQILRGQSMHLSFKEYNFFASSIVGGIAPIAVGIAMGLKGNRVWCFLGDMAYHMGLVSESIRYAKGHNLPVCFVVEDNGLSVGTPTKEVWGCEDLPEGVIEEWELGKVVLYRYQMLCDHVGAGVWVTF